jgi:hypothetical protein
MGLRHHTGELLDQNLDPPDDEFEDEDMYWQRLDEMIDAEKEQDL